MIRTFGAISLLALLAACGDGAPCGFGESCDDTTADAGEDGSSDDSGSDTDTLSTGTVRPPQTESTSDRGDITRAEAVNDNGGGRVSSVAYNADDDTFFVDGLAFDGENVYSRGVAVSQLGPYAVFDGEEIVQDFLTDDDIGQFVPYRALYGVSRNSIESGEPRTAFSIVRTGAYVEYGFGGFIYQRNGDVEIPTTGQAIYTGDYAGMRVFDGTGGLEYTTGEMFIQFDFDDFNQTDGIYGQIYNRQAFDIDGNPIGQLALPVVQLTVDDLDNDVQANGEFSGPAETSFAEDLDDDNLPSSGTVPYEIGEYYAVLAGDMTSGDGGEVVGIIVLDSTDPRYDVPVQETGGFILYRGDDN